MRVSNTDKYHFTPDKNNEYNYMLDTCIFNELCGNEKALEKLKKSLDYSFRFYYTYIQIREMKGITYNVEEDALKLVSSKELSEKKTSIPKNYL